MITREVLIRVRCDCKTCRSNIEGRHTFTLEGSDGKRALWVQDEIRKQGWILSPNGKYCCAPGHERDLGKARVTHRHH